MKVFSTIVACVVWIFIFIKFFKLIYFRNVNRMVIAKLQEESKHYKFSKIMNIILYALLVLLALVIIVLIGTFVLSKIGSGNMVDLTAFYDLKYRIDIQYTNSFVYHMAIYTGIAFKSLVYLALLCVLIKYIYVDIKMFFRRKEISNQ